MKKKNIEKLLKIAGLLGQIELLLNGASVEEIEEQIKINGQDEIPPSAKLGKRGKGYRVSQEDKDGIIDMHQEGDAYSDIREKYGVSNATIAKIIRDAKGPRKKKLFKEKPPEDDEERERTPDGFSKL